MQNEKQNLLFCCASLSEAQEMSMCFCRRVMEGQEESIIFHLPMPCFSIVSSGKV